METLMLVFLLLNISFLKGWEDPYQMIPNEKNEKSCKELRDELSICKQKVEEIKNNQKDKENKDKEEEEEEDKSEHNVDKDKERLSYIYFNKLFLLLTNQLCKNPNLPTTGSFQSLYTLTPKHCDMLQNPSFDSKSFYTIYDLLENILSNHERQDEVGTEIKNEKSWLHVDNSMLALVMVPICILLIVKTFVNVRCVSVSPFRLFIFFFTFLFFISIPWNWWHLYKQEVAGKRSRVMGDVPPECNRASWGVWFRSLWQFESTVCQKYHEALEVDPVWEVTPAKAVMVTLSKMVLDPLELLGASLSRFLSSLLGGMPMMLQPFVMLFLVLLVVVLLLVKCKYRFSSWLFAIEPSTNEHVMEIKMLKEELKMMRDTSNSDHRLTHPASQPSINWAAGDAQEYNVNRDNVNNNINNMHNNKMKIVDGSVNKSMICDVEDEEEEDMTHDVEIISFKSGSKTRKSVSSPVINLAGPSSLESNKTLNKTSSSTNKTSSSTNKTSSSPNKTSSTRKYFPNLSDVS